MYTQSNGSASVPTLRTAWRRFSMCLSLAMLMIGAAYATEGSGSIYPLGVETVMPGLMPAPGGTVVDEFSAFYQANELVDSHGHALLPGFHLRAGAVAGKLVHNWGVHALGGTLVSSVAAQLDYIHLNAPFGKGEKTGFGNSIVETAVAYKKGALNWWYGFDVFTPGFSYNKNDLVNIGQHNYATAPSGAFTYMPNQGRTEVSSRFQYIVNYTNDATHYRSGNEFLWEYAGMQNVTKRLAIGGNGYFYKQTTNDLENGLMYLDGNRGRNVVFGPQIRYHFNRFAMILKYQKDFLTQNRPVGNEFWIEFGVPLGHPHHD